MAPVGCVCAPILQLDTLFRFNYPPEFLRTRSYCQDRSLYKPTSRIQETTDTIKRIDTVYRKVVLMSTTELAGINKTIDIDKILGIKGELVDYMDDTMEVFL